MRITLKNLPDTFDLGQAEKIVAESEVLFFNREHLVSSGNVMRLVVSSTTITKNPLYPGDMAVEYEKRRTAQG